MYLANIDDIVGDMHIHSNYEMVFLVYTDIVTFLMSTDADPGQLVPAQ